MLLASLPVLALVLLASPHLAVAHGGGLNAEGCHKNRKTGDYHCHRGGGSPARTSSFGASLAPSRAAPARGGSVYFANCSHARAEGAAPVRRGDPGYSSRLDRDGDGVGCE